MSSASSATPRTPPDEPGVEDATRRTRLANERTFLAWWRTGLAALALSIGVGRLVPSQTDDAQWPYQLVGAGIGVLGIAFVWLGYRRTIEIEAALDRGSFVSLGLRVPALLLAAGIVLGAALIALVIFA